MSTLKYNTWVLIYTPGGAIFTISSTTLLLPPESPSNTGDIPVHYRIQPIQDVTRINAQITFLMHKSPHRGHRKTLIVSMLNASTVKTLLPVGCFAWHGSFLGLWPVYRLAVCSAWHLLREKGYTRNCYTCKENHIKNLSPMHPEP